MKKGRPIFTITTIFANGNIKDYRDRCVGFYYGLARAQTVVLDNLGDLAENGYYNYVVIEETFQGIYPFLTDHRTWWYHWVDNRMWIPCQKPQEFSNTIGFGMG